MLGTLGKFSSSIFAKIFLFIIAIPFVFWGMGDLFSGGNQNTIPSQDTKQNFDDNNITNQNELADDIPF